MSIHLSSSSKQRRVSEEMEFRFPNEDLTTEVLTRVPAKSALQFKCVSKGWNTIISRPSFRRIHSQKLRPTVCGIFFQERYQWCNDDIESINYVTADSDINLIYDHILDFLPVKVVLMASTNGLLCCRSCCFASQRSIYVCNPANKEYIAIEWPNRNKAESVALAFDPFLPCVGKSTSFKLVSLYRTESEKEMYFSFQVYSSKTQNWRSSEGICHCAFNLFKNKGVYVNGMLYWLTEGGTMLSFDVEKEQSQLIDLPANIEAEGVPEICIGDSEGCLHYIKISEAGLQDWVLQDASESKWALKYSISLSAMEEEHPFFLYNMAKRVMDQVSTDVTPWVNPLAFKDGLVFMTVCSQVYSYEFKTRKLNELCGLDSLGPNSVASPIVLPYGMSLVPLESPVISLT